MANRDEIGSGEPLAVGDWTRQGLFWDSVFGAEVKSHLRELIAGDEKSTGNFLDDWKRRGHGASAFRAVAERSGEGKKRTRDSGVRHSFEQLVSLLGRFVSSSRGWRTRSEGEENLLSSVLEAVPYPVALLEIDRPRIGVANQLFLDTSSDGRQRLLLPIAVNGLQPAAFRSVLLRMAAVARESDRLVQQVSRLQCGSVHHVMAQRVRGRDGATVGVLVGVHRPDISQIVFDVLEGTGTALFVWRNTEGWPLELAAGAVESVVGYEAAEFLSGDLRYDAIVHPDDLSRVQREVRAAEEDVSVQSFRHHPYRVVGRDGQVRWADDHTYAVRDDSGRVLWWQGVVTSVRTTYGAKAASGEFGELFRQAVLMTDATVWSVDRDLRVEFVEGPCARELARVDNDWKRAWHALVCPEDRETVSKQFVRLVEGEPEIVVPLFRMKDSEGRSRDYALHAMRRVDENGEFAGALGLVTEVTEVRRRTSLEARNRRVDALERMAVGVAHRFNNLLTIMQGNIELAMQRVQSTEALGHLEEARTVALRASQITSSIMSIGAERESPDGLVRLNDVLERECSTLTLSMPPNIVFDYDFDPVAEMVRFLPNTMREVLRALVENSVDAIGEKPGRISVVSSTRRPECGECDQLPDSGFVYVTVEDDGPGMDEVTVERAVEPFFSTKQKMGVGMGLTVVDKAVRQAGGHLLIEAQLGEGTKVHMALPHVSKVSTERSRSAVSHELLRGKVVVTVDDDPLVLTVLQRSLAMLGCIPKVASGAEEALELLSDPDVHADVLLTDMVMPKVNGIELAKRVKAHWPDLPVAYVSAGGLEEQLVKVDPDAVYLSKPFRLGELAEAIGRALGAKPGA